LNVFIMYLNVFLIYLNVLILYMNVYECIYKVFMVYFNVFIIGFNVFQWVWKYLNVFIDIVIGISPSYVHCKDFVMCTFAFTIHNDYLPNMLYHYNLSFHSHWFVSTFLQFMKKLYINAYFSHLYIILHSTFHVVTGCAEHSSAQV
jgi:hypothetical protein